MKEHPHATDRKVFRVGYFVTVDVDAFDASEATVVGECACHWPGNWSVPHEPVAVEGEINGYRVTARIVRSEALMVKPMDDHGMVEHPDAKGCTGLTATWCPVHGDCVCARNDEGRGDDGDIPSMDDPQCPLHRPV